MLHTSRQVLAVAVTAGLLLTTGCTGNSSNKDPADGMPGMPGMTGMGGGMPGMGEVSAAPTTPAFAAAAPNGTGLSPSLRGYTLLTSTSSIAATSGAYTFHITGPNGKTVTRYQPYESAFVLCYVIRSDLTQFHELQPAMREDGTWTLALPSLPAGSYRMFVSFAAPDSSEGTPLVYQLSSPFTVRGTPARTAPASTDGYDISLSSAPTSGTSGPLTVTVARGGKPVVSFDRYLDAYVHLTALHAGDLAAAHILSLGATPKGDGTTTAEALFPEPGTWRVFAEFELNGTVHTAAVSLNVPGPSAADTP